MERRNQPIAHNPHLGTLEQCVQANSRLVHKVCQRFAAKIHALSIDYEDLQSVGMIGLMKAYERFDPTSFFAETGDPVKFSTYAVPMILGEIRRFLRDHNGGAKFSRYDKEVGARIVRLLDDNGLDSMPAEEIAERLDMPIRKVKTGLAWLRNQSVESLSATVFENDGDPITLEDQLSSQDDQSGAFVDDFLILLSDKYRDIVEMRLQGMTQDDIGCALGITQVQISRLLSRIGEKLKQYMNGQIISFSEGEMVAMGRKKIDEAKLKWMLQNSVPMADVIKSLDISSATYWNYKTRFKKGELTCESDPTAAELLNMQKKQSAKTEQSPPVEVVKNREVKPKPEALISSRTSASAIAVSMTADYVTIEEAVRYTFMHLDQSKKYTFQISVQEAG